MSEIMSQAAHDSVDSFGGSQEYVTFVIAGQLFGIPVLKVQDVLSSCQITRIPLAPPEISGSLNLRGRIVTAMDVRRRLGLPPRENEECTSIVVEHEGELYSLMVDSVGEVLALRPDEFERNPPTLQPHFKDYSLGIHRLNDQLMVVLDVNRLLSYGQERAA